MVCINTKAVNVSAASAEMSIRASSGQVSKGDIVYVIITVNSSDAMSGFEGSFSYDSRVLQYMTGGSVASGNDNWFQIEDTGRETGVNSLKYSIKFVARKEGSTSIELKQPYAVYNSEDSSKMSVSSDTLNIMVKSKSAKKADATSKNDNKEPDGKEPAGTEKPYDGKKNNDESAKDDIKPSESPKPKTKKKKINADDKKNTTKDAVKSVTATYQNSVITIHYNEEYKVVPLENDKDIPTGFGKTEIVLSGHVITAYATEDNLEHKFVLIYCKCGRQEPEFYLYDTENDSFMPYDKVKAWYKESIGNTVVGSDSVSETKFLIWFIERYRKCANDALAASKRFHPTVPIQKLAEYASPIVSCGNQTGEGWFLTGEMIELIKSGVPNIVCTQPFGCLPNHVVGKGVIKELRHQYPDSNIVAVDYDPGASEVNQLNRIKLMLSTAGKNLIAESKDNEETA